MASCQKCGSVLRKQRGAPASCVRHGPSTFARLLAALKAAA